MSDLMTTSEAAATLGVTPGRIRHMVDSGQLTRSWFGRNLAIQRSEVEQLVRTQRHGGRPWSPQRAAEFLDAVDAGGRPFGDLVANASKLRRHTGSGTLAAQWLDHVAAGDQRSAERIEHALVRRYRGSHPLAHLAEHLDLGDGMVDWTLLRHWADHIRQHPAALAASIADQPPSVNPRIDNLLAAVAEVEADSAGLVRPSWTAKIPPLVEPWEGRGTPRMIAVERRLAAPQFVARRIHLGAPTIWRTNA